MTNLYFTSNWKQKQEKQVLKNNRKSMTAYWFGIKTIVFEFVCTAAAAKRAAARAASRFGSIANLPGRSFYPFEHILGTVIHV